jgi:hypothetical protein
MSGTTAIVEATRTTAETTQTVVSSDVLGCLEQAGLSDVEKSDVDTWHGFHGGPAYAIVVHKLATPVTSKDA